MKSSIIQRHILDGLFCPVGTINAYGGATAPTGWLLCDGSSVLRAGTYAALFAVIGASFGAADGTHFNVPDFRGRFLRGWANGQATDPDAAARTALQTGGATGDNIGSAQADSFKSHQHTQAQGGALSTQTNAAGTYVIGNSNTSLVSATGGNETRPLNVNVNYIIRY